MMAQTLQRERVDVLVLIKVDVLLAVCRCFLNRVYLYSLLADVRNMDVTLLRVILVDLVTLSFC